MPTTTSELHRAADEASDVSDPRALPPATLTRPAAEGARIVALHWLVQCVRASGAWSLAATGGADSDNPAAEQARALRRVRVALRRLRATLRDHRVVLASSLLPHDARALRRAYRGTGRVRERDVLRSWLKHHHDEMPDSARHEAERLRGWLHDGASRAHRRNARTLGVAMDRLADSLADRLSQFALPQRVGEAPQFAVFASTLAERLERGARRLRRELVRANDAMATGQLVRWHRIRLQLKRQRAMLAPFIGVHPELAAWMSRATMGQDAIGAMRDATELGRLADRRGYDALTEYALDVAAAHYETLAQWCADVDAHWHAARGAVKALQELAVPVAPTVPVTTEQTLPAIPDDHGLPMEIERKFLLHGLPPTAAAAPSLLIEQGWLPGTLLRERLRRTLGPHGVERLTRTIKLGRPGSRIEVEEPTDPTLFAQLWPLTSAARIRKRRHLVPFGALTWEIDVFLDRDLVLAELELTDEAQAFDLPDWLSPFVVKDVTNDPAYLNSVMAQRDVPAPDRATT